MDKASSYIFGENEFETGKMLARCLVRAVRLSQSHLAIEGHARTRRTVPPYLSATPLTFDPNQSGEPREVKVSGWWVRGASQQPLLSEHPGLLPHI